MIVDPAPRPAVAVVVVSFNSRGSLVACLDSLNRFVGVPFETVVVDNASEDGSREAASGREPRVQVIANPLNVGFARACNQGLRATSAPLVLLLNPDAEVTAGAVEVLAARLEARAEVGVVGPLTRHPDGTIQVSTGPDLTLSSERRQRRLVVGVRRRDGRALAVAEARHGREHEPDWVSGACLMVRREALEAVGGLDESFFLYEEDADLCRRIREAGWRVLFTPEAEVRHTLGQSMSQASRRAQLEYHRSHLVYYRKHNGALARLALRLLMIGRGLGALSRGVATRDSSRRRLGGDLLSLALTGP